MTGHMKRSAVWNYFIVNLTDESKVSYSLCLQEAPRGGKDVKSFNTSNMQCHLEVRHPDEFSQLQAKEKDQRSASSSSSLCDSRPSGQRTVTECLMKSQSLAFDSPRAKEITRRI